MLRSLFLPVLLAVPLVAWAQGIDPNLGRNLAATCANCHLIPGKSAQGVPAIAGQPRQSLLNQLKEFKAGKRQATVMDQLAKGYTDAQLDAIAAYYAAQK